jgi:hypothetical protein
VRRESLCGYGFRSRLLLPSLPIADETLDVWLRCPEGCPFLWRGDDLLINVIVTDEFQARQLNLPSTTSRFTPTGQITRGH